MGNKNSTGFNIFAAFFSAAFFVTLNTETLATEYRCPSWTSPDRPILEHSFQYRNRLSGEIVNPGPRLDATSYFWLQGTWFEMPLGYRGVSPLPSPPNRYVDMDVYRTWLTANASSTGYDADTDLYNSNLVTENSHRGYFTIWMPSLRWVERNTAYIGGSFRPCESGRPPPSKNEYIVRFRLEALQVTRDDWDRLPLSLRRRIEFNPGTNERLLQDDQSAPVVESEHAPAPTYSNHISTDIRCAGLREPNFPNPFCSGYAIDWELGVLIFIRLPAEHGRMISDELWREPVEAAFHLIDSWQQ